MEWIGLLIIGAAAAGVFVWLARRLDEDAPRPIARRQAPVRQRPISTGEPSQPEGDAARRSPAAPMTVATTGSAVQAAETTRLPAATLVAGGMLLFLFGQLIAGRVPPDQRAGLYLLLLAGALAFLLGGRMMLGRGLPDWLADPLMRAAAFLQVAPGQVVMLALAFGFAWLARAAAGNDLLARHATVSAASWLTAVGLAVAGSLPSNREEPRKSLDVGRLDWLLTAALFLGALLARGVATAQFPDTFSGDEGSAGLFALLFLEGKADNLFISGWFSFPSFYFLVQSLGIAIGGQTIEAIRLTSAVGGALAVVALYWLGRAMFDRLTAGLAAAYLLAAHYHIHMSRIALNNVWDAFFGALAMLGLWYGWRYGRRSGFILCGLALGFGQYFYVTIRVLPLLFLIWAAVAWLRERETFRLRLPGLALAAIIALIVYLPLAMYFVEKPDEYRAPLNRVTILGPWLEQETARTGRSAESIILDQAVAGALGFTHRPLRLLYDPGSPLLLAGAATLFILGVLWGLMNFDMRYLLLFLPLLAAVASNALSQDSPASQRYILAMPSVALFIALPLTQLVAWFGRLWPRLRVVILAAALGVMAWIMLADLNYYFNDIYDHYVLGGGNTEVATEIAYYLRDHPVPTQDVYFFGFPRMGYYSLSTIPYLAPQMNGIDVNDPLTGPPPWALAGPTLFIFLPERLAELDYVRQTYPGGVYREFRDAEGQLQFASYQVVPASGDSSLN